MDYLLERVTAAEVRPLRRALLHPGLRPDAVDYAGDADPYARHVGALRDGVLVGIASVHPHPLPTPERHDGWRVRDIAVEHGHRGRGVGLMLLDRLLEHIAEHEGRVAWGAVRLAAVGFFTRHEFVEFTAPWSDPHEGPQRLLWAEVHPRLRDWAPAPEPQG